ncbi:MAG TPA: DnaB-like helicase N-terminal domain-containing protein, partial [Candidatus Magasanikbacteria bacterium]|nr:DnaB-like helicase N-terminal domain-containing protein [Candidatus Magasanikbacteria bacterium]
MPDVKLPPQDIEAEKSVLGALMIDKNAVTKIADSIMPPDFYLTAHQKIYEAVLELFGKNQPIDILSVTSILKDDKNLESVGGSSYLGDLINTVPTSAHIAHYAKIVREKRVLRDLIALSANISEEVFEGRTDVDNLLDRIEQKVFGVAQRSQDKNFVALKDELKVAYERIERLHREGGKGLRGVTTGFSGIDRYLSGFQPSDLIILGARPSLGKTTLALDMARGAAKSGVPVGLFSIEMSRDQIVDRII